MESAIKTPFINMILLVSIPTFSQVAFVVGGLIVVFVFAYLVVRFTKYGGGNYGLGSGDNDLNDGEIL